jgi:UDP-N-acetylmuramate: L-alanyl-gamma-D-glutamyl-meso-diaminopimelate ligase
MAVAGTHGKTTTTSMLSFILDKAGLNPGFLIGGVATDFNTSARLGKGDWFVIEADEYDSAFFDKRPKFMHYRPQIALLNNLEFDHADIYADLPAIQQQFQYFLRTVPRTGLVIKPSDDVALNEVVSHAQYSQVESFSLSSGDAAWRAELLDETGQAFTVWYKAELVAKVAWSLIGGFNVENGLAAIAAAARAGIKPSVAAKALEQFTPVKRRLEVKSNSLGVTIYDDFAHHPTAVGKTISALKNSKRHQRIIVVLEFASYTMRLGVHARDMAIALDSADFVYLLNPSDFSLQAESSSWGFPYEILESTAEIVEAVAKNVRSGDAVLVMSNRGFENIHQRIAARINGGVI